MNKFISLPALCVATAFSATSVAAQQCQAAHPIDKLVFDMDANEAYLVVDMHGGEQKKIWTTSDVENGRYSPFDIEGLSLSAQDVLQTLLNDMTSNGFNLLQGVEYAAPNMSRAKLGFVDVSRTVFDNEDGSTISTSMEINLKRGNSLTQFFEYDRGHSKTPDDFFLEAFDIEALDIFLEEASHVLAHARDLSPETLCL